MKKDIDSGDSSFPDEKNVPVIEEHVQVDIRKEETGIVRALKKVHAEDFIVSAEASEKDVHIERVPLNKYVNEPPGIRHEGDTMIIPVVKEEVIVQTRLVLVEEVRITHKEVIRTVEKPVTLRREEIVIERSGDRSHHHTDK